MQFYKTIPTIAVIGALAACGGSSSGSSPDVVTTPDIVTIPDPETLDEAFSSSLEAEIGEEEASRILASFADPNAILTADDLRQSGPVANAIFTEALEADNFTAFSNIPTIGSGSYSGFISITNDEPDAIGANGVLRATVDFQNATITGTADNFFRSDLDTPLEGTLNLDAQFDRTVDVSETYGIDGAITGTLRDGDSSAIYDFDDLDGDFLGEDGSVIFGSADGSVTFTPDFFLGGEIRFGAFQE